MEQEQVEEEEEEKKEQEQEAKFLSYALSFLSGMQGLHRLGCGRLRISIFRLRASGFPLLRHHGHDDVCIEPYLSSSPI
jgi:hypothetical protein